MKVVELAFFGIGFFGTFIVVHIIYKKLQQDSTNIEFKNSMAVALVAGLVIRYGLHLPDSLLSPGGLGVFAGSVFVAWMMARLVFGLSWWEGLILGGTASVTFLGFYLGSAWLWGGILGFP